MNRVHAKKPTLAQVAELAGVSVPTVSKVIYGRDDVAGPTRERVQAALSRVGYESPVRRRLRSSAPGLVDLVFDGLNTSYSLAVLTGITGAAATENVEVVLSTVTPGKLKSTDHRQWSSRLAASGRRGLILVTSEVTTEQLEAFARRRIPVVVIDPLNPPPSGFVSIGATNWAGGKSAAEHLIELGHRRIAYVGGPDAAECSVARLHGYLAALRAHGIEVPDEYIVSGAFNRNSGVRGAALLMSLPEPPTAIFAASDLTALGVLDEARRRGIRVPEELSLVGFDGTDLTEQSVPRLTSVSQPLQEMGRSALRSVLRLANGEELESSHVELATSLVVRDSTAPPPVSSP
ncbi:substrate-binding domain-containing protein [Arthrobacter sp. APC 3897]|uniref:LacI family DNA-binding transcriptional regulator n=1 Tax=Arthrobacter sp. APC 3897 TaxID=3035204 RepID=UPI0025B5CA21|nr:substrate-binding domain-containing protein [Arthrobacter sp. APC 3897]MDN3480318.1 substrate-binding domain-containing protein [Arthrobacter sp. APC 3897]